MEKLTGYFRQVHLDFHTSPIIEDICRDFDARKFVETLKRAHVNSVTVFAKCHHGMSYYNTKVGIKHPHLKIDLLGEIVEECKREDIRVVAYISVGWDNYMGERHPEWLQCDREGRLLRPKPYEPGWYTLCLNTPYVDYVKAQTKEVLENYDVDGIFFDIVFQVRPGCLCYYCRKSMKEQGLDIESEEDLEEHSLRVEHRFMKMMRDLVKSIKPEATVFFNGRIGPNLREEAEYFTHFEIESLPTAFWGYWHFPFYVRFVRTLGKPVVGMTARFHKGWGDFGGVKTIEQLEYECATMLANGALCSIGDQMHPRGKLEDAVYEIIGQVYRGVEEKEEWCRKARPITEIAIMLRKRGKRYFVYERSDYGATKILLELKYQFDVIDQEADFSKYKVLIIPDEGSISDECEDKLKDFLKRGGAVIFSHSATLSDNEFRMPGVDVEYIDTFKYRPEYIEPISPIFKLPTHKYVVYEQGLHVKPKKACEVLAKLHRPYFSRTYRTFTSHAQAPAYAELPYPAIVRSRNVIYISFPIFKAYFIHGYHVYKRIVEGCLELLMPERLVKVKAPVSMEVTLLRQDNRLVVHLVNFQPHRRGLGTEYIEEVFPLRNLELEVRTEDEPSRVYMAPQRRELEFSYEKPYTRCVVPEVKIHQMVVFEI